jgi:hypothetical protein
MGIKPSDKNPITKFDVKRLCALLGRDINDTGDFPLDSSSSGGLKLFNAPWSKRVRFGIGPF